HNTEAVPRTKWTLAAAGHSSQETKPLHLSFLQMFNHSLILPRCTSGKRAFFDYRMTEGETLGTRLGKMHAKQSVVTAGVGSTVNFKARLANYKSHIKPLCTINDFPKTNKMAERDEPINRADNLGAEAFGFWQT
ncbi:Hypothetical predicted protein, partial [Paramuricea clavata]